MDFVDLDKVLDEFEEEEKAALSIVPGEELKPSGYVEFLEKHENQVWESVTTDASNLNYSIESDNARDHASISYDEPYDRYSPNRVDSVQDSSLSPTLGLTDQLVITGERARGFKDHITNRSKRGTIASKTTEVQTDELSPTSELELSSLPFPKSDILVEGHDPVPQDREVNSVKTVCDQNSSPIYASVDSNQLFTSKVSPAISSDSSSLQSSVIAEKPLKYSKVGNCCVGFDSNVASQLRHTDTGLVEESVVGFQQINTEMDENELNMYLNEIETDEIMETNSYMQNNQLTDLNVNVAVKDQDLKLNNLHQEINLDTNRQIDTNSKLVTNESVNGGSNGTLGGILRQDQTKAFDSFGKTAIEEILDSRNDLPEQTDNSMNTGNIQKKGDNSIYEQLMFGKMEIEQLLVEAVENQRRNISSDKSEISINKALSSNPNEIAGRNSNLVNGLSIHEHSSSEIDNQRNELKSPAMNTVGDTTMYMGVGARPKDPSVLRKNRPSSLLGLSKVNLDLPSPNKKLSATNQIEVDNGSLSHQMLTESVSSRPYSNDDPEMERMISESKRRMNVGSENDPSLPSNLTAGFSSYSLNNDIPSNLDQYEFDDDDDEMGTSSDDMKKTSRPTTLNLPTRCDIDVAEGGNEPEKVADTMENSQPAEGGQEASAVSDVEELPAEEGEQVVAGSLEATSIPQRNLGDFAPFWIPDAEADSCMICYVKFTLLKRRHHCRACGKVLCSQCCSQKSFLRYMDNKEARVCIDCFLDLNAAQTSDGLPSGPNPNNPSEYCSKIPPNQQVRNPGAPPTVMVPTGVLKSAGRNRRGEPKQVMFSDGIRPGGDLTELDGHDHSRSHRRSARAARKAAHQSQNAMKKLKSDSSARSPCLVPAEGLPPLYTLEGEKGHVETDETLNQLDYTEDYRVEGGPSIYYAVNKNLSVAVKVINLDCCMNRVCWSFVSRGMVTVGQRELVILLELTEEESTSPSIKPPHDIFLHYHYLYDEALKGNTIQDMGHTILHQAFLGSRDYGGFLYVQPTFQCLNKLLLPEAPYAFGILLQKWEAPWAKVFPIRLMLRLGAEFRYYPCPLISVRNRKPVFYDIGHTIMNLLADFRNFQYSLSQIRGVTIHMEDKKTVISIPRNRYNDIMKVVRSSNEHVMAFGSSFSCVADSHLVCIQNEESNYQTQAINIQNKPRQVTGASFVVFNGALKSTSGLSAKSSIVEDGVMVQVLPEAMAALKQILKDMKDHTIACGPLDASEPDEILQIKWTDNDKNFNIGVKSYLDGRSLDGVESVSVKSTSDFVGKQLAIRWTRVYFLQQEGSQNSHFDPIDLTRLTEEIAQASCTALVSHLEDLRELEQIKIGLRVNLTRDAVGYEIGSKGQGLPEKILTNLDTCLIPIIHQASEEGMILELVFHILD